MLKKLSLQALQFTLNQAVALDPSMPEKLKKFDGKWIELVIMPLHVRFYMGFAQGKILLSNELLEKPNTIIHSSPLGLIRLSFLPVSKMRSLFNDDIRISGDIELGQDLKKIMDEMDIDWEGHLAEFTGDVAAHHIGKIVRKGLSLPKKYVKTLQEQSQDYLMYELQLLVPKQDLEQFYKEVDDLRLRLERLQAHIEYLSVKNVKN